MLNQFYILILCIFVFLIILVYDNYKKRKLYRATSNIPGPRIFPIIGSPVFITSLDDILDTAEQLARKYGNIFKVWIFHYLLIIITKPAHLKIILSHPDCLEKGPNYKFVLDIVGNGLITSPGTFVEVFAKHGGNLVEELEKYSMSKDLFDVDHYLREYAFSIVWETTMGVKMDRGKQTTRYSNITARIMEIAAERTVKIWLHPNIIFKRSKQGREFYKLLKIWNQYLEEIIIKRREELKLNSFEDRPRRLFLDHLLSENSELSFKDVMDEVAVNIIGGTDTVGASVSTILICLGMHQDVQQKAMEELEEVLGSTSCSITSEDLSKLVYLERVIKESMRLYAPIPLATRRVTKEIDLGDYILPRDAVVIIGILGTHRDPEVWPNPLEFDPDRFLPEEVIKRDSYSFLPFSLGTRDCIGQQFAMMEIKTLIATILRSYKIVTNIKPDTRLTIDMVTKFIGGSKIRIIKRQ